MKPLRIGVLGAGPAGLYASVLLKRLNPNHEIFVLERNPEGATYGFGVVMSDKTLTHFRDADPKSYDEMTAHQTTWEAIMTYHRGVGIRSGGHFYLGIGRKRLLDLLQQRAEELGVKIQCLVEVTDLSPFDGCDLIIAADGVNSLVRRLHADAFQPTIEMGNAKFVWLGTDWVPPAFTFIFEETEWGVFQAHIYPYSGDISTFIIMCHESTWKRAGLDRMDEAESAEFCRRIFARYLGNHTFYTNRSLWISFPTVRCKNWSHGNIVLLGDAVHTAHWSIGSGTKLAMEDAISLVKALERHPDLQTALREYQVERRPVVEKFQEAGTISERYCENAERYMHLEPMQFAFQLMIRSKRMDCNNLRVRDPYFMDAVERWFAQAAAAEVYGQSEPQVAPPPPILNPIRLRGTVLDSRVVLTQPPTDSAQDGLPDGATLAGLQQLASGRPGLLLTDVVAISAAGRITSGSAGLYTQEQMQAWQQAVAAVRMQYGVKVALQLGHAGRRGATKPRHRGTDRPLRSGSWPLLAPSALPYAAASQTPRAMERPDLDRVRSDFVAAAKLALVAGFDMLQLHMAQGYLLASFLSPLTNQRRDEYGGSFENRIRFPLEVLEAVRAVWPAERPLAVALSVTDWVAGGFSLAEGAAAARVFKEHGCDLIHVLAGQTTPESITEFGPGFLTSVSEYVRNEAQVRTLVGGYLTTSGEANTNIVGARADLCALEPVFADR